MEDRTRRNTPSTKKSEANRRNARMSTGPKTARGKAQSRRNSLKHGMLSSTLLTSAEGCADDRAEFRRLVTALTQSFLPQGGLEELWVARIAICWWRQNREHECEENLVPAAFEKSDWYRPEEAELKERQDLLSLAKFDRLLRYEKANHRELTYSVSALERLQRARKQKRRQ